MGNACKPCDGTEGAMAVAAAGRETGWVTKPCGVGIDPGGAGIEVFFVPERLLADGKEPVKLFPDVEVGAGAASTAVGIALTPGADGGAKGLTGAAGAATGAAKSNTSCGLTGTPLFPEPNEDKAKEGAAVLDDKAGEEEKGAETGNESKEELAASPKRESALEKSDDASLTTGGGIPVTASSPEDKVLRIFRLLMGVGSDNMGEGPEGKSFAEEPKREEASTKAVVGMSEPESMEEEEKEEIAVGGGEEEGGRNIVAGGGEGGGGEGVVEGGTGWAKEEERADGADVENKKGDNDDMHTSALTTKSVTTVLSVKVDDD